MEKTLKINPKTIEEFRKLGMINETALRNYNIKREFEELKVNGIAPVKAIHKLMDKYYRSWSVINAIVYKIEG